MLGLSQCLWLGLQHRPQVDHYHWQQEDDQTDGEGRSCPSELRSCEGGSLLNNNVALGLGSAGLDHPGRPLRLKLVLSVVLLLTVMTTSLTIVVLAVLVITNILSSPSSGPGSLGVAVLVIVTVIAWLSAAVVSRVVGIF